MFPTEVSNLPGQIEAALQFLRFTEEIVAPKNYGGGTPEAGRDLSRTELEVKDSALTVLLEYFNHPVPAPEQRQSLQPSQGGADSDPPTPMPSQ
jgi:hypothetical protein